MKGFKYLRILGLASTVLLLSVSTNGQSILEVEKQAQVLTLAGDYVKARPMWHSLFENAPYDKKYYDNYLKVLFELKDYDTALALNEYMMKIRREDLSLWVDQGQIFERKGEKKKAAEVYQKAIALLGPNEFNAIALANAFKQQGLDNYQISTYEQFRALTKHPVLFAYELASLYQKQGKVEKAIDLIFGVLEVQPFALENAKQSFAELILTQPKNTKKLEQAVLSRLKKDPNSYLWKEVFAWLQAQNGDHSDQLKTIISLDEEQNLQGQQVYKWLEEQLVEDRIEPALQAVKYLTDKPQDNKWRILAEAKSIEIKTGQLQSSFPVYAGKVNELLTLYRQFFSLHPKYSSGSMVISYAHLLALYAHEPRQAFDTLDAMIVSLKPADVQAGYARLAMGDYQIIMGNVWEAALLYSQVDKTFKEDFLGEEARFRNAKLAYYRGDFEFAQAQLSVLKASTSEFIANDALYLSVLITENTPEDQSYDVLKSFAQADLLQFQHKYTEADILLDSLQKAVPEDEMQDDILMQRASIASKMNDYAKAQSFYEKVVEKYKDDVLADDALMKLGQIFEEQFKKVDKAIAAYEQLILEFPSSTYVQEARLKLNALTKLGT